MPLDDSAAFNVGDGGNLVPPLVPDINPDPNGLCSVDPSQPYCTGAVPKQPPDMPDAVWQALGQGLTPNTPAFNAFVALHTHPPLAISLLKTVAPVLAVGAGFAIAGAVAAGAAAAGAGATGAIAGTTAVATASSIAAPVAVAGGAAAAGAAAAVGTGVSVVGALSAVGAGIGVVGAGIGIAKSLGIISTGQSPNNPNPGPNPVNGPSQTKPTNLANNLSMPTGNYQNVAKQASVGSLGSSSGIIIILAIFLVGGYYAMRK